MFFDLHVLIVFGTLFLSFFFFLLFAFFCQIFLYKSSRRTADEVTSRSLGLSELQALLRDAADEAMKPLENRIASLEAEIRDDRRALPGSGKRSMPALQLPVEKAEPDTTYGRVGKGDTDSVVRRFVRSSSL